MADAKHPRGFWISTGIALLAMLGTTLNSWWGFRSYKLNQQSQQAALFTQFQQEYASISGRFPSDMLKADFRPERGSDDYRKLEDYWIFCFAEWYATEKVLPQSRDLLWNRYYAELIGNALATPSLRYVFTDMRQYYGAGSSDWVEFYGAISRLAKAGGHPLGPNDLVQSKLRG